MLIDVTERGERLDPGAFPKSLVVAVRNGSVHRKNGGRFRKIAEPDYRGAEQGGNFIKAFRLKAEGDPTFRDPGYTGWEFTAATYDTLETRLDYLISLVQEERGGHLSWVLWFNPQSSTSRMTIALPDFDVHDNEPIILDPQRHIVAPRPPTAWERLGEDNL